MLELMRLAQKSIRRTSSASLRVGVRDSLGDGKVFMLPSPSEKSEKTSLVDGERKLCRFLCLAQRGGDYHVSSNAC